MFYYAHCCAKPATHWQVPHKFFRRHSWSSGIDRTLPWSQANRCKVQHTLEPPGIVQFQLVWWGNCPVSGWHLKPSMSFHITILADATKSVWILTDPTPQHTCYFNAPLALSTAQPCTHFGAKAVWMKKCQAKRLAVYSDNSYTLFRSCPGSRAVLTTCPLPHFLASLRPRVQSHHTGSNVCVHGFCLCNP